MPITVEGDLAATDPGELLKALAEAAALEGRDPDEFLEKALRAVGATRRAKYVNAKPRARIIRDHVREVLGVYERARAAMLAEIEAALMQAAEQAAPDAAHRLLGGGR